MIHYIEGDATDPQGEGYNRVVCWFSCGAPSAVAAKMAIRKYGERVIVAYIDVGAEHSDNVRFLSDCERWLGQSIVRLKSERYVSPIDVWRKRRFIKGPRAALCTTELKKMVRFQFEQIDDIQVFGYTIEEQGRAERFRQQNPDVRLETPLIDACFGKQDCLGAITQAGIEIPAMYKLGYSNNNCIGCCKGGMGYWNKIRKDFPAVFQETADLERELNATVLRDNGQPLFLDQLEPNRGNMAKEPNFECGLLCQMEVNE